ncbi:MAG TPA: lysylphosphatidylglycerol synthase transmembrane domain-containing protein [Planctomycetota bacterium]|nr:lysylphosphatidylglycerol synthase transmembrane domain-containing protein [Planctomycetota bacterium]
MLPRRYQRGIAASVVLAAAVYLVFILQAGGFKELREAMGRFPWWGIPVACGLASANWAIRFLKWERYRRLLGVRVTRWQSLLVYLSGFALSITPGKMGEAYKSLLLKRLDGSPISRTAPIVVAERLTDLLGLVVLMGVFGALTVLGGQRLSRAGDTFDVGGQLGNVAVLTLFACAALLFVVLHEGSSRRLLAIAARLPMVRRLHPKLETSHRAAKELLAIRQLAFPTAVSIVSWGCEALALYFIASRFSSDVPGLDDAPNAAVTLPLCFFAYAFSMIAGNLAIVLPAGIGLTEGILGYLLDHSAGLTTRSAAATIILLRACTLWLAVLVGLIAAAAFERTYGRVEETDARDE